MRYPYRNMAKTIDYSKWDHIEISDDEDDTHPNIDTPSLFKWRHEARIQRMEEQQKEKDSFKKKFQTHQQKAEEIKMKIREAEEKNLQEDLSKLKIEAKELEKQEKDFKKKEEELKKKERLTPLNIDTLCKDGKSKTIINKYKKEELKDLTDEERMKKQREFEEKNEKLVKEYGMLRKYDDSQEFLTKYSQLVCEETANSLVLWCVELEIEEKHQLMAHVAHQTIVMQFILELARSLEIDPRGCVKGFFSRIKVGEKQYMDAFNDELNSFKDRIRARAQARIDAAMKEYEEKRTKALREQEEEERQKRLGPGGVDPVEVFESLPPELQECFEKKDTELLQKVLMSMPKEEAENHLKRCIDSGLWVPNAKEAAEQEAAAAATSGEVET